MAPAGGGNETGESGQSPVRHGVDRSSSDGAAAGQELGASIKRKATLISEDSSSLVRNEEYSEVACMDYQKLLKEIGDLRSQLDNDVKEHGYCEANEKLRVELGLKVKQMQCLTKQNEEVQGKNDGIRKQNEELQVKNDGLEKQNKELKAKNDDLVKENEELRTNIGSMRKQNVELQAENGDLTKWNEDLQAKNAGLMGQNKDLQAKNDGLAKQNKDLQAKKDDLVMENEELHTSTGSMRKWNGELQAKNGSLTKWNEELQTKIANLMEQNEELQTMNDGLAKQNEELQAKNVGLVKRNEEVQTNNDSMRKQNGKLEAKNSSLTRRNEDLHVKNDGLMKSNEELQTKNDGLTRRIEELEDKNDGQEDLIECLWRKERESNDELQEARKELRMGLEDELNGPTAIGIKRMGELDLKPFQIACRRKYGNDDYQTKAAELVLTWQEELKKPSWHPFKVIEVNGELKGVLDDDDAKLRYLWIEYGDGVCNAVKTALMELNEYNASGRYVVPELWNFKKARKATVKEVLRYLFGQMETTTKRRRG